MKKLLISLLLMVSAIGTCFAQTDAFITVWDTDTATVAGLTNKQIQLPISHASYPGPYDIKWEDVNNPSITGTLTGQTGAIKIDFPEVSTYRVYITNIEPGKFLFFSNNQSMVKKMVKLEQWGTYKWPMLVRFMQGAENADITATDIPDLSLVQRIEVAFWGCKNLVGNSTINDWTFHPNGLTSMTQAFEGAAKFNQPLNKWDVSKVTSFLKLFYGAITFDRPLDNWVTSNVNNMQETFYGAFEFNQNISGWNTSNVTNMSNMFFNAYKFNQNLGSWKMTKVTNATGMLDNTLLTWENYDATLAGWGTQTDILTSVPLGATGLVYSSAGKVGRDILTNSKSWMIYGDFYDFTLNPPSGTKDLTDHDITILLQDNMIVVNNVGNNEIIRLLDYAGKVISYKYSNNGRAEFNYISPGVYIINNVSRNINIKVLKN